ncbi:nucleoside deaminase [Halothiobacillus neapolitanus]|uniref:Guanine deaminase n=1 Tax=Halothiobacillus neapolitanus (strain ATCC 23641 / DSM 15147 / CIP 104769 / NCIMB 8539 / c2) TaxID=555778 RepID=D0KZ29_HALNC|nr:nucleoside deaminase [Halothiobacillus neapolitanus]ACX95702.1 Guanine deaminase [Halothiobacillus neapolitanus c2]TDN66008.1 tRNA(Arg) A34 adenosine deaminase TadA [Halothiobacillus neapolitanus]
MCDHVVHEQEKQIMRQAIEFSREKMIAGFGGPFGAVISRNGEVIATGFNQVTSANDPTAHAEVSAIRAACQVLNTFDLSGCEIYTSCEPCPMCLSAIYWARLDRIYYANSRQDAADIGFDDAFLYEEIAKDIPDRQIPTIRLLEKEAILPFNEWRAKPDKIAY